MKRLLSIVAGLLGLALLGALAVVLLISLRGLRGGMRPASNLDVSPIQSPTSRPSPTATSRSRPTPTSYPSATPTPSKGSPQNPVSSDLTEPVQITTRAGFRVGLDADGDIIVWKESDQESIVYIVAYDLRTRTERVLKSLPGGKRPARTFVRAPRISEQYVVWVEYCQGTDRDVLEVHGYDLTRGQEKVLGEGDLPDVSGSWVLWNDPWTNGESPLVLYDLNTGQTRRLTGLRGKGAYISGDWIIYASHHPGTYSRADLHVYNLVAAKSIPLGSVFDPPDVLANQYMATDGSWVVWQDDQGQVRAHDLTQHSPVPLGNLEGYIAGRFSKGVLVGFRRAFNLADGSTFQTFLSPAFHLNRVGERAADYQIGEFINDGETVIWTMCLSEDGDQCKTNDVFLARRKR